MLNDQHTKTNLLVVILYREISPVYRDSNVRLDESSHLCSDMRFTVLFDCFEYKYEEWVHLPMHLSATPSLRWYVFLFAQSMVGYSINAQDR